MRFIEAARDRLLSGLYAPVKAVLIALILKKYYALVVTYVNVRFHVMLVPVSVA